MIKWRSRGERMMIKFFFFYLPSFFHRDVPQAIERDAFLFGQRLPVYHVLAANDRLHAAHVPHAILRLRWHSRFYYNITLALYICIGYLFARHVSFPVDRVRSAHLWGGTRARREPMRRENPVPLRSKQRWRGGKKREKEKKGGEEKRGGKKRRLWNNQKKKKKKERKIRGTIV